MDKLTELAKQYKKTKSQQFINEIFLLLDNQLKQKADYIFYQQSYNIGGKEMRLVDTKKLEFEDILQELRVEVLRLLKRYNPKKSFSTYIFSTLWKWEPEIIRKRNKRQDLTLINESELEENDEEENYVFDKLLVREDTKINPVEFREKFIGLTKAEKNLLNLMIEFPDRNQSELAEMIGVNKSTIARKIRNIKNKKK